MGSRSAAIALLSWCGADGALAPQRRFSGRPPPSGGSAHVHDHRTDPGVHVAPICAFTFDRSARSRSTGARTVGVHQVQEARDIARRHLRLAYRGRHLRTLEARGFYRLEVAPCVYRAWARTAEWSSVQVEAALVQQVERHNYGRATASGPAPSATRTASEAAGRRSRPRRRAPAFERRVSQPRRQGQRSGEYGPGRSD
jgi:hypothetical protein